MYEQVEKPKENKSVSLANSVALKKSNTNQGFGFVDNRPESIAQRKQGDRPISDHLQWMGKKHGIVQRRFVGVDRDFYTKFRSINFKMLGLTEADACFSFLKVLDSSDELIAINIGSRLRFDPQTKELLLSPQHIKEMQEYAYKHLRSIPISQEEHRAVITTVANLTHELSHARDAVIVKKGLLDPAKKVLYTELKAWGFEAITAHKLRCRLQEPLILDEEKENLIAGWSMINPDQIESTYETRNENELTRRFWD